MATTATPRLAGHTVITPDLSKPKIGQPTVVAFFQPDHSVLLTLAFVLAIGPVDEQTEEPTLTVAYPKQPADDRKLGSVRWADAFERVTGVQHYTHPDAREGKLAIAWGGDGDIEIGNAPEIPQPEGDAQNPIFARQDLQPASTEAAELQEAIIAQRGQAPEGAHLSPATSEAGETHDATVAPKEPTQGIPPEAPATPAAEPTTVGESTPGQ